MGLKMESRMFSLRFQKNIRLTHHVKARMDKRDIHLDQLLDLIETGNIRHKSETDLWIYKAYTERSDNSMYGGSYRAGGNRQNGGGGLDT
jgi:hypothetical protein